MFLRIRMDSQSKQQGRILRIYIVHLSFLPKKSPSKKPLHNELYSENIKISDSNQILTPSELEHIPVKFINRNQTTNVSELNMHYSKNCGQQLNPTQNSAATVEPPETKQHQLNPLSTLNLLNLNAKDSLTRLIRC
jgi:hypothetical protein